MKEKEKLHTNNEINENPEESSDEDTENDKEIQKYIKSSKNITQSRDQLYTRKDNIAFFVDTNGLPINNISKTFANRKEIRFFNKMNINEIKMIIVNK